MSLLPCPSELWPTNTQTDRDVDVIRIDVRNTVESLRDRLQALLNAGHDDSGFPILRPNGDSGKLRMVGYIGAGELEHALGQSSRLWSVSLLKNVGQRSLRRMLMKGSISNPKNVTSRPR